MVHSFESRFAIIALILACVFAFVKGGAAERMGSIFVAVSWFGADLLSLILKDVVSPDARKLTLLAMDAGLAMGMLILAFRFAKLWLGLAMLMLSGELALHGAAMGDWGFGFRDYIRLNNLFSFGLLMLLVTATLIAWMQRRRSAGMKEAQGGSMSRASSV